MHYLSADGIQPVEFGLDWAFRLGTLRYQRFDGQPVVHVSPVEWDLDPRIIRQAAYDRFYVEIPPPDPSLLSFQFAPQAFPGTPFYDYPSSTPAPSSAQWLMKKINGADQVWISLRDAKLSRRQVAEFADQGRMGVIAEFADSSDRLMHLGRTPNPQPGKRQGFRPYTSGFSTALAVTTMALMIAAGTVGAYTDHTWLIFVVLIIGLPLMVFSVRWMSLVPRSVRARWLAAGFDGSRSVRVHPDVFGFTSELVAQIAASRDYFYTAWDRKPNGQPTEMVFVRADAGTSGGTGMKDRTSDGMT
ncbi:hypothetical protein DL990_35825 [Amycolatopsis sp. WAC 01416]|uniref:hypothetical protein n=1 Tax=Amycolatopsis sp. WAC 01416 TaxID=2203196 RepID=UPI000F7AA19C|nr:hypothetical protein [Amycolatopsis sp. WAC 01416]RSN23775.1 hypothetical protein DL990_35825 [Amycolatopsis sp. WAC 01416]